LRSHGCRGPPGGFKQSGIGYSHGEPGCYEPAQSQMIVHDFLPGVKRGMIDFLSAKIWGSV
jgi:succinate-semialdehyde dehydrogenase/glutarate-semialdehyde dehydrogenase